MNVIDSLKEILIDLKKNEKEESVVKADDAKSELEKIIRFINRDSLIKKD
jgi:hypothetical protein